MKLIFVRHGETDGNRLRQYIGSTDLPLNETGRQQALAAGAHLADVTIDSVYYSPSKRAIETAALIMYKRQLQTTTWGAERRLAELHFGKWEGLTYEQVERQHRERLWAWYHDPWNIVPPEGESLQAMAARVEAWVEAVIKLHREETVLAVSHGGPLRWFWARHVLGDARRFHAVKWEPGQYAVCVFENESWACEQGEVQMR